MTVSGVRSSWEASALNWRTCRNDASRRAIMSLKVAASRPISSDEEETASRSAEGNVLTSQVRGLDRDLAGRAEELKGLVQDSELGKLRGEILEREERADPMLLHRAHSHGGGSFQ